VIVTEGWLSASSTELELSPLSPESDELVFELSGVSTVTEPKGDADPAGCPFAPCATAAAPAVI
jgi:hypothetical protein